MYRSISRSQFFLLLLLDLGILYNFLFIAVICLGVRLLVGHLRVKMPSHPGNILPFTLRSCYDSADFI